jgi:hypothetical protein
MLTLFVAVQAAVVHTRRRAARGDGGQATAEYALVLLGAATVALILAAWAMKTGKITALFDAVIDKIASNL